MMSGDWATAGFDGDTQGNAVLQRRVGRFSRVAIQNSERLKFIILCCDSIFDGKVRHRSGESMSRNVALLEKTDTGYDAAKLVL